MKSFNQYHQENPIIWEKFKELTFKAINKRFKNYSSKGIFELIRWHTKGDIKADGLKINNNYTADYARMFMDRFPQYKGFFRTREKLTE